MKFDVELIGLPARIKVKFAPESVPVFEPNPRFSYDRALAWFDKEINNRIENHIEEDTLKYQRAYNEALNLQSEWSKEKYNEMFITITNVVNGGVDGVNAAPEESDP